jgi:hypothetical protein
LVRDSVERVVIHGDEIEIILKVKAEGQAVESVDGHADDPAQSVLKVRLPDARPRARKEIIVPGGAGSAARRIDQALILSIARARSWLRALRQGDYTDTTEIARHFGLGDAHVRRLLRLTFLAPDIVEAIIEGRQPRSLTVKLLLRGIPLAWSDQRNAFGLNH